MSSFIRRAILSFLIPVSTFAAGNDLTFTSDQCKTLVEQHQAICRWKKTLDPDFQPPEVSARQCVKSKSGKFSMKVSECLPDFVQKYTKKKMAYSGPNCWGTTLNFHGFSKQPRYVWPEEMAYWMNSPVCRKLNTDEPLLPGDVINVYGPEYISSDDLPELKDAGILFWDAHYPGRYQVPQLSGYTGYHWLLHSVTYLSHDLAYGKDSPAHDDLFYFHPMNRVYGRPQDQECQENQTLEPYSREYQKPSRGIRGSKCSYFSLAYRCGDLNDYLAKQKRSSDSIALQKNLLVLEALQAKLFPLIFTSPPAIQRTEVIRLQQLADAHAQKALNALKSSPIDSTTEMLLVQQYFTAQAIRKSLEQLKLIPATFPL